MEWLRSRGINDLFPVQKKALEKGLLSFKNLLVSAPTGSGKTLVAEMAIFNALKHNYNVAYLLPLRSIAFEKYKSLSTVFGKDNVMLSVGDYHSPQLGDKRILIATYERMDSILRHEPEWLEDLGVVVVDEIHYVGDPERGPTLETVVTQLKMEGVQLLGLSATVGNLEEIAQWLEADLVYDDWRPVELREGVMDSKRYEILFEEGVERVEKVIGNAAFDVAYKYLKEGQVLYFAPTRNRAERVAEEFSKYFKPDSESKEWADKIRLEVEGEFGEKIAKLVERKVAFHHAGLTNEARMIIEDGFRAGVIRLIAATPTLAAGVNLPAKTVVIEKFTRYNKDLGISEPISVSEYKQMAGRAGRPGLDKVGISVLIARDNAEEVFEKYVKGEPEPVKSSLDNPRALRKVILGLITRRIVRSEEELEDFISKTLFGITMGTHDAMEASKEVLKFLINMGAVAPSLAPTRLGSLISKLYVDPYGAKVVRDALRKRVGKGYVLGYLHLISLTPDMPKRSVYAKEFKKLKKIAYEREYELIVREYEDLELWASALKVALVLEDWINEVPDDVIAERHKVYPGDVRVFSDTASWLLHAYSELCKFLGMKRHAEELGKLEVRMKYGVREELVSLVKLPYIGRVRARKLWEAGIRGPEDILEKRDLVARIIGRKVAEKVIDALLGGVRS